VSEQEQTTPDITPCQGLRALSLDDAKECWRSLCKEPALADFMDWFYAGGGSLCFSAPDWIPFKLLNQTSDTWSRHYGRRVPFPEAVAILKPVRRLATTLAQTEGGKA